MDLSCEDATGRVSLFCEQALTGQQDSQVPQVIAGRAGDDDIAKRVEKGISIKTSQRGAGVKAFSLSSVERSSVRYRACGWAVAINAVGSRAQHGDVLAGDLLSAGQRELQVAATYPTVRHLYRYLAP